MVGQAIDLVLFDQPEVVSIGCLAVMKVGPKNGPRMFGQIEVALARYLASGMAGQVNDLVLFDLPEVVSTGCLAVRMVAPKNGPQMFDQIEAVLAMCLALGKGDLIGGLVMSHHLGAASIVYPA